MFMFLEKIKPIGLLFVAIIGCYSIHKTLFIFLNLEINLKFFNYSLEELYVLFSVLALIITSVSIVVKQKNIDLLGNVFMLLTCIKMICCFFIIRPYASNINFKHSLEKWNYLFLFLLFLVIETIISVQILNKKSN